jgi:hypothetical protein
MEDRGNNLFIKNVSIIPMSDDLEIQCNINIVITNGYISQIGATNIVDEKAYQVIEGDNQYLIPGLFDMHVHLDSEDHLPLFLLNGVTGIREMGNTRPDIFELRNRVNRVGMADPYMAVCGPILEGEPPFWDGFKTVETEYAARQAVQELAEKNTDFIKVYDTLSIKPYRAIIGEAHNHGLAVTGHIPHEMNIIEAINAGQDGVEHMSGLSDYLGLLSTREAQDNEEAGYQVFTDFTIDEARLHKLCRTLSRNKNFLCPTLILDEQMSKLQDYKTLKQSQEAQYVAPHYREVDWNPEHPSSSTNINGLHPLFFQNLGLLHRNLKPVVSELAAYTTILAGSDTPNPFVIPGFALLHELELLVESGLRPYQALEAATYNGARALNVLDELGTIEVGKRANLVLLQTNPLENISGIRQISGTILNGLYMPYDELIAKV